MSTLMGQLTWLRLQRKAARQYSASGEADPIWDDLIASLERLQKNDRINLLTPVKQRHPWLQPPPLERP